MTTASPDDLQDTPPPPAPLSGRHWWTLILPLLVFLWVSPPWTLTVVPPVYHDDFNVLAPAVGLLDGTPFTQRIFDSTPLLEEVLQGKGSLTPGLGASFSVGLAAWFSLRGASAASAREFVWGCALAAVLIVAAIGTLAWSPSAGATAGVLLALNSTFWLAGRTVRPETFTLMCYLAALLLVVRLPRGRERLYLFLSGLLIGLGLGGHPVGAVLAPAPYIALLGDRHQRTRLGSWLALAAGTAITLGAYLLVLWTFREGVKANLGLHSSQRPVQAMGLVEALVREWSRFSGGYGTQYSLGFGGKLTGLCVLAGLVYWAYRVWKPDLAPDPGPDSRVTMAIGLGAPVSLLVLMVLSRDHNFLHLIHMLPLTYLAGAAALDRVRVAPPPLRARAHLVVPVLLVLLGYSGIRSYRRHTAPYRRPAVVGYDRIEELLAEAIPEGALVLANENAWLAARAAGAQFLFNRQYLQYSPDYARYPVQTTIVDQSHMYEYRLDIPLLRELEARTGAVMMVVDMFDWAWNIYYPTGKYASSFLQLERQLAEHFDPVRHMFSKDRGFVSLYRLRAPGPRTGPPPTADLYVEGEEVALGAPLTPDRDPVGEVDLPKVNWPVELAVFPTAEDRRYLVRLRIARTAGKTVVITWNGAAQSRFLEASQAVPVDFVVSGGRDGAGRFGLFSAYEPAAARIESIQVFPILPPGQ